MVAVKEEESVGDRVAVAGMGRSGLGGEEVK
jgi:D-arabinose 5-phosphate isomerase GutQ